MVVSASALVLSVFLIPPLKMQIIPATATQKGLQGVPIPPYPTSSWKPDENLQETFPGGMKPYTDATNISQCASSCCANEECISWQYHQDKGCIQGKYLRLGMEKNGPAEWCADHPPYPWQGLYLYPKRDRSKEDVKDARTGAYNEKTWNPNDQI